MNIFPRIGAYLLCLLCVPVVALWIFVAQPSRRHNSRATTFVEPERLRQHVRLMAQTYAPRSFEEITNLNACADYIASQFTQAGGRTSEQTFGLFGKTYRNVIGQFGPAAGPRVVVGAHYDACGSTPGADDNASGVAGLIELAYLLGRSHPRLTVEVVAFTLEEPPFFRTPNMGSARYAKLLQDTGVDVRAMICLEMIGYFSDRPHSQAYPIRLLRLFYPSRGHFMGVVGSTAQGRLLRTVKAAMQGTTDLPVYSLRAPRFIPGIDFSDHINFWDAGFPAVMVTDSAFYRNSAYHLSGDTFDRLDYDRLSMVVKEVHAAVLALAGEARTAAAALAHDRE